MSRISNLYHSVETISTKLKKNINLKPRVEILNTNESLGHVLYDSIYSSVNIPSDNSSHMDGFAVLHKDIKDVSEFKPKILHLNDEVELGKMKNVVLKSGEASRIPTGGQIPKNADTIIPIEYTQLNETKKSVNIFKSLPKWSFISKIGNDIMKNELLFKSGHILRIQDISLLNIVRVKKIKVFKKPTVAIIPTGNELTNDIKDIDSGKILNTNGYIISKLIEYSGGIPIDLGITTDDIQKIQAKIKDALYKNDVILTIGGSSVGHKDLVADSINLIGKPGIIASKVKLDRGRVTKIAVLESKPIIVLPGPIQGAMNAFIVFVLPLIRRLLGMDINSKNNIINANLTKSWIARKKFQNFQNILYVNLYKTRRSNDIKAEPITGETADISVITKSNGYILVPENTNSIKKLQNVQVNVLPGFSFSATGQIGYLI
ncbi:MAG: molybdopterin molybdotransferase MoeA [Nitrososphaeraceae archaeon]